MGSLALALGCRSSQTPSTDQQARQQLNELAETVSSLKTREPALPGLVSGDAIAANALGGLSEADAALLGGRLCLDALQRLSVGATAGASARAAGPDLSPRRIHSVLERPLPAEQFGREYFTRLLDDTKARVERDPDYRRHIADAAAGLLERACECNVGPCWLCIIIIIIIIIIIL
jgi:hypothetical protein